MILKSGGNIMQYGNYALDFQGGDPYNPLNLPPFTIRCKFTFGHIPYIGVSQTLVDAEENVWDITTNSDDWTDYCMHYTQLLQVYGANTTGVTKMVALFEHCENLTDVALFDTRAVTDMRDLFYECFSLKNIPLYDTSSCTNIEGTFYNCYKVESGALALYQQVSSQSPIPSHYGTFRNCGRDTVTGAAELAQIPDDWK